MASDSAVEREVDTSKVRESGDVSVEVQAALKGGNNSRSDASLLAAQTMVSNLFGNPEFFRQGIDADAGAIHDSVVPNPLLAGGMMDRKSKEELVLGNLKNYGAESLKQINESYKQQYGHDMLDDMKKHLTPDAYRRAQLILNGEKDPGYLSPTQAESEKALNSFKDKSGRPLSDYVDAEQLAAIQRNEAMKRGIEDELGIGKSDGPAQVSKDLQEELLKKYPEQLKGVDVNSVDGAQMYVAAFYVNEVERFNSGWYGNQAKDNPDLPPDRRKKFDEVQKEWNEAVAKGDTEATRKIVSRRYNPGHPAQESEVEAQRGNTPNGNGLRDGRNTVGDVWSKITRWVGVA
ncbi:MAG: hypothetical protein IT343_20890 [Candidatus Melainabacteria bacterium]|nr:hypothetical protein [Candidatus Melainabacteria bacterium]